MRPGKSSAHSLSRIEIAGLVFVVAVTAALILLMY